MAKIIKSAFVILAVAVVAGGATYSFFSDEEKSVGNTFTAGKIDLKVDNTTHYNGMVCKDDKWECEPWADVAVSEDQGKRKDGSAVLANRSDLGTVLGVAETSGSDSDSPVITGSFYSLGFGGKVVLKFDNLVLNGSGDDLKVFEVTGGVYPDETAKVEVSQDGSTWLLLGTATRDESFNLDAVSLPWIKYIRFIDTSTTGSFTNDADGYDLDAIKALHCGADPDIIGDDCENMTWKETDLGPQKFFNFSDIKPGDNGEDTVSLHVYDNDAWGRIVINNITDKDNTCTEPEKDAEDNCAPDHQGELRKNLDFSVWLDEGITPGFQGKSDPGEGDNRLGDNEIVLIKPGEINADGETWNIKDAIMAAYSKNGIAPGITQDGHITSSVIYYFGMGWELPIETGNDVQSDIFQGNITFEVEQYRNNSSPF